MKRIVLALLAFIVTGFLPIGGVSAKTSDCADLRAYFKQVDKNISADMLTLLQDDAFVRDLQRASKKASKSDMSILALSPQEMEPFIRLISVPGDALLDIDDADVPSIVIDLHESALSYYITMPAMLRGVANGGVFAAMAFGDQIDDLEEANYRAQRRVERECPDEVEEYADSAAKAATISDAVEGKAGSLPDFSKIQPSDLKGIGYSMLFFATEESLAD